MAGLTRRSAAGGLGVLAAAIPAVAAAGAPQPIALSDFETVIEGLKAPEGVAADRAGVVYVSSQESACVIIAPDGTKRRIGPPGASNGVARGIRGANGCCFDRGERHLYVAQTPAGNVLRMRRLGRGRFGPPEPYGPVLGAVMADADIAGIRAQIAAGDRDLGYADGLAFDIAGNLWVTLPFANRIVAITPDRRVVSIVSDPQGRLMDMPTNLAFGGPDLRDLYIVSRLGGNVIRARSPIAGLPLAGQQSARSRGPLGTSS